MNDLLSRADLNPINRIIIFYGKNKSAALKAAPPL